MRACVIFSRWAAQAASNPLPAPFACFREDLRNSMRAPALSVGYNRAPDITEK